MNNFLIINLEGKQYLKYPYDISIERIEEMQSDHPNLEFIFVAGDLYMTINRGNNNG